MACNNDEITEEIEALQAIMMDEDEIKVDYDQNGQPNAVHINIKPATAQNIDEQHVRVTLVVKISPLYPDEPPTILLRNPRGIDDNVLKLVLCESTKKCEEFIGFPVIYELTELVREKLTANNTPSCPCAICLFHFIPCDHFTKTQCFHYFHSYCLGRYIINCEETAAAEEIENQQPIWMTREKRELICPICRDPLGEHMDGKSLFENTSPEESKSLEDFSADCPEIVALQEKMNSLYMRQKAKGGIINLEEEKNKFLVSSSFSNEENEENLINVGEPSSPSVVEALKVEPRQGSSSKKATRTSHVKKDHYYENNYSWNGRNKSGHKRGFRGRQHYLHRYPESRSQSGEGNNIGANKKDCLNGEKPQQSNNKSFKNSSRVGKNSENNLHTNETKSRNLDKSQKNDAIEYEHYDSAKKSGNSHHIFRHSNHKGGRGGKIRGPPPGFGELERPMNSNATS